MKMNFLIFALTGVCLASGFVLAKHIWRGETMKPAKAEQRWGKHIFDKTKFKNGDYALKASMAASMVAKDKQFLGKSVSDIRTELGDPDGFYFTDTYPAYIIDMTSNDAWQIVFLLNNDHKVSQLIIHKNCCDK